MPGVLKGSRDGIIREGTYAGMITLPQASVNNPRSWVKHTPSNFSKIGSAKTLKGSLVVTKP